MRKRPPKGPKQHGLDLCGGRTPEFGEGCLALLRATPTDYQATGLRLFRRDRAIDAKKGASVVEWVRAPGPTCVWHECQWQATVQNFGAGPCGLLRDCTRGTPGPVEPVGSEDTVRPSWRHEEPGRNDLAAQSKIASTSDAS